MVPLLSGLSDTIGLNVVELGSKTVSTSDDFFSIKVKIYIRCLKLNFNSKDDLL